MEEKLVIKIHFFSLAGNKIGITERAYGSVYAAIRAGAVTAKREKAVRFFGTVGKKEETCFSVEIK